MTKLVGKKYIYRPIELKKNATNKRVGMAGGEKQHLLWRYIMTAIFVERPATTFRLRAPHL